MKKFVMQWHLSDTCNLKCIHCYQEKQTPVLLEYEKLIEILNQYKELLKKLKRKGHINITGGEPLCCPYFFKLLEEFKKDQELYSFSILTNGTLLTDEIVKRIKKYNPEYVQVSLEGGRKINDLIRGKYVFAKVKKAIKLLKKYEIFTSISFTANHFNYKEFPKVVRLATRLRVDNVWSDRYIPINGGIDDELFLNKEETLKFFNIMLKMRLKLKRKKSKTTISMYRALQFLYTNDFPYSCDAGINLLTVMENGDLVPCRRMPIIIGSLFDDTMYNYYKKSPILKDLQKEKVPKACNKCEHSKVCRGGLKCLSYILSSNYDEKDYACPKENTL